MEEIAAGISHYRIFFDEGGVASFTIDDAEDLQDREPDELPRWVLLEEHRCPNCTIAPVSRRSCPVAIAIQPAVDAFKQHLSYENVRVVLQRQQVRVEAVMPAQQAMLAVLRPLLFRSSCPILMHLRPPSMPFMLFLEDNSWIFRLIGMELVGRYLHEHGPAGLEATLRELQDSFDQFHILSQHVANRIRSASSKDAPVNALVHLDMVAQKIEADINEGLKDLARLFQT